MPSITRQSLEANLHQASDHLLGIAGSLSCVPLASACAYVVSEITNEHLTEYERFRQLRRAVPQPLAAVLPGLLACFDELYDINLYVHWAGRHRTVIDIRYYAKWLLDAAYRQQVAHRSPMLHSKVALPFWTGADWQGGRQTRFDINWKVRAPVSRWRRWLLSAGWRIQAWWYGLPPTAGLYKPPVG